MIQLRKCACDLMQKIISFFSGSSYFTQVRSLCSFRNQDKLLSFYNTYFNFLSALPEKVRNLTIVSQDHDRVLLTWLPPSNIDRARVIFAIGCRVNCVDEPCKTDRCKKLKFIPSRQNLLHTNITITGFRNEGLLYVFEVTAKHRLYNNSEGALVIDWNFVAVNYTGRFLLYTIIFDHYSDGTQKVEIFHTISFRQCLQIFSIKNCVIICHSALLNGIPRSHVSCTI